MNIRWCLFLCAIIINSTLQVSAAKFGRGSHSYPKSGGLSGSNRSPSHSYPTSHGGLSGNSHGYPSSGGQSHAYPSSGGQSHAYPSSGGQSHGYPSSGGSSGSHGYPQSPGLSGNSPSRGGVHNTHTTNIVNNYHYSPPQQIKYTPTHGGAAMSYPVYHQQPPPIVYQYQNSNTKYGTLIAGLALMNLATLGVAGAAYAKSNNGGSSNTYKSSPGEVCKFGIKRDNGDYEETRIQCDLISSFIYQEQAKAQNGGGKNTTVVTTTVTNVTMVNGSNGGAEPVPAVTGDPVYTMLANGTLVPVVGTVLVNGTVVNGSSVAGAVNTTSPDSATTSSVTTVTNTTTTTVTDALSATGKPVEVTPGMHCYVIRSTPSSNMKKAVPCGLLQTYATTSLKRNSAARNVPVFTVVSVVAAIIFAY